MEYNENEYCELKQKLGAKLKKKLDDVLFLELNKDIVVGGKVGMDKEVPLPVKSEYLINGIKNNSYAESIKVSDIVSSIIFVLGCDPGFKYNNTYITIIKSMGKKTRSLILKDALDFAEAGRFSDAYIYFTALNAIYPKNSEIAYNIALSLKEWGAKAEKYNKDEFNFFYKLSFYEFIKLSEQFPDFWVSYYHLGFYYSNEHEYSKAHDMWTKAYSLCTADESKGELSDMIESLEAEMSFEEGRKFVIEGNVIGGLRKLIPLVQKYGSWSEAKYYMALGYRKSGNYKKAVLLLNELLDADENFSELYNELGLCYYNLGNIDNAIKNLETAVKMDNMNPAYLCNLAIVCYSSGDKAKTKEYIKKAYEINPQDEVTCMCKNWADGLK